MAKNPNPAYITDPMWGVWEGFHEIEPSVELGGIYANKAGYHNTREANEETWPENYSIQHPIDQEGPDDKAAGIDLTFPNAQDGDYSTIAKYSQRLLAAGKAKDPRTWCLKEFFGNTDDDREVEGWDYRKAAPSTSDSTHLWHIHLSVNRRDVTNPEMTRALLSILRGESLADYLKETDMPLLINDKKTGAVYEFAGIDPPTGKGRLVGIADMQIVDVLRAGGATMTAIGSADPKFWIQVTEAPNSGGGSPVDPEAVAEAVADEFADRLQS